MSDDKRHFNQEPLRKAEFIRPPNLLKAKVGAGGLSEDVLQKAQNLLKDKHTEFPPLAELYFTSLMQGVQAARQATPGDDYESIITRMIYPAMQLRANGAMFHYELITRAADKLIEFLEVIAAPDEDAIEVVLGFIRSARQILKGKVTGDGGKHGVDMVDEMDKACMRYFEKHPNQRKRPSSLSLMD